MSHSILIVDDEETIRRQLKRFFEREGYEAITAADGGEALQRIREVTVDVALLDLRLPDMSGLDVLKVLKQECPSTGAILITAFGDVDTAVRAIQQKADHFLLKPVKLDALKSLVETILERYRSREEMLYLKGRLSEIRQAGRGQRVLLPSEVLQRIELLAENPSTNVLILGETGTGKGMVANAIHQRSDRRERQLVDINCAGLSTTLLESELFGHERGAFTDAKTFKRGLLELAHESSLFLDEIGDLSPDVQAKLLKVIEDRTFRRVGGTKNIEVDVRLMAATHVDLDKAVKADRFRSDLYYRLTVVPIRLPPLRKRREDIPALVQMFVEEFCQAFGRTVQGCSAEAEAMLAVYRWPGNIRELRNVMERAVLLCDSPQIEPRHLPDNLHTRRRSAPLDAQADLTLQTLERKHIQRVLALCDGNRTQAASHLGIHRATLIKKIKKYDLDL